jgi:RimJ/RimL family protein N-acetyltransferase
MIEIRKFNTENYPKLISWIRTKEMLMQFAGPNFEFPLTQEQIEIPLTDKNRFAYEITGKDNEIIGYCEIYLTEDSAKLGRIIIGEEKHRGNGLGQKIVKSLIEIVFSDFNQTQIELNVFDWNIGAIQCYEKVGFTVNPNKKSERIINGENWTALNMILDLQKWKNYNMEMETIST